MLLVASFGEFSRTPFGLIPRSKGADEKLGSVIILTKQGVRWLSLQHGR